MTRKESGDHLSWLYHERPLDLQPDPDYSRLLWALAPAHGPQNYQILILSKRNEAFAKG